MRLLVTGGAGFIGSNFIRYWLKSHPEDEVVNFDKLTYAGNLESLKDISKQPHYRFVKGDICDAEAIAKEMKDVDIVVHFAAESHVDRSISGPSVFLTTNVLGTQVLLDAALKANVKKFHHVSTDEVFGALPLETGDKFTEETPYDPRSPYSASKAASDHIVRAYHTTYGLPITITNCSNNFGPFMFPEKFIPLAITNLLEGKKVPVYGDGLYARDWLYVEDHARAIDLVLQKGQAGDTYLVGGMTELIPNIEVAKRIIKILGKTEDDIEFVKDRPGHDRKYDVDWSKIKHELGWQPEHSLDDWLEKTVDWYKHNEWWWQPLKQKSQDYFQQQYSSKP